ncbi:hypothetical protein [Actinomadura latina]|uniref:Uncharacterized protein n=1 Tax=Actinomadura latina TaxID=163603 RepID=A0A846Z7F4_9ACTN|nr:hypothetical protein [Actinomadura latina]NKZ06684.1 hypothetical protein [Actinomadura latina]
MSKGVKRAVAAGGTFVIAGAVNVATGLLIQDWTAALWAATVVLLVLGGALQASVTWSDRRSSEESEDEGRRPGRGTQRVEGTKVGGDALQSMPDPGEQIVSDSEISGSLNQRQGNDP